MPDAGSNDESLGTVLLAAGVNLAIAAAKAIAGVLSGSSAMLSEAAHSLADTVTQVLLLTALRRSARRPDARHPLGYVPERYFWAFLASVATFVGGAVFAVIDGIRAIIGGEELGSPLVSCVVLAIAFVLEGTSLARGSARPGGRRGAGALQCGHTSSTCRTPPSRPSSSRTAPPSSGWCSPRVV